MTYANAVLLIGNDEDLVRLRGNVLRCAGFDVQEAITDAPDKSVLQTEGVHVVVLCHTLHDGQRNKALDQVEGTDDPARLVPLLRTGVRSQRRAMESADIALELTDGPTKLIAAVRRMMPCAASIAVE